MEERVLRAFGGDPFLDVVDDEEVDGLVELDEVVNGVLPCGIDILYLEEACADVEHPFLRIELLGSVADGIDEVGFSASAGSIDEHRVELLFQRMFGNGHAYASWESVAVAFDEVAEGLVRVELWVERLWCCIEGCRREVCPVGGRRGLSLIVSVLLALDDLSESVLAVGDDAVGQSYSWAERAAQHFRQQVDIVLLEVLVDEWARYLNQHRLRRFSERFEGDGLEPCFELLLGHVLADERKRIVPSSVRTYCHIVFFSYSSLLLLKLV